MKKINSSEISEKNKYRIWLSILPGIGPISRAELLKCLGSPEAIWNAKIKQLQKVKHINAHIAGEINETKHRDLAEKAVENLEKHEIRAICIDEDEYPEFLKCIYDAPYLLYAKGNLSNDDKYIGVVGSRRATSYGLKMAENISYELSKCGLTIVSGMASGIDTAAHNGALRAKGRTIGVMGCGLDMTYPYENRNLMKNIIKEGAAISEFLPGMPPIPQNFPMRNRIISGMSMGVVIVEANEKSGSLITANFALEQGRDVFAVPGNLISRNSCGTNKLIREGAKIVTTVEDILEEFNFDDAVNKNRNEKYKISALNNMLKGLDENERKIVDSICEEPIHIDKITEKTGLSMQVVNALLIVMELKGLVRQNPGKIFELNKI